MTTTGVPFRKGHGTGNDFIVVNGLGGVVISESNARALCDRHKGIGADGILRVAKGADFNVTDANYFMDFRNADGSIGATCGNGLRVFARYLVEANLEGRGSFKVGTHAGTVTVTIEEDDKDFEHVAVEMGKVTPSAGTELTVTTESGSWSGVGIGGMNNHCVTVVADIADAGTLLSIPRVTPAGTYPDGVNVEFIAPKSPTHIAMRTHERGVGETLSCGSGSCAAAFVWADKQGLTGEPWAIQVDVLGGTVFGSGTPDGTLTMRGPAEFVADGVIEPHMWQI